MKVNRQKDISETNKTTAFWLYEFAYDLEKKAQNIDYLKEYLNKTKNKTFNTIEEKLADMRDRVGLDLAKKVANEMDHLDHKNCECKSQQSSCSCKVKTAKEHSSDDVENMRNILKYMEDMIKNEPHLDAAVIFSRCEDEEGLGFRNMKKKIDQRKLINYVNDLINEHQPANKEKVTYQPRGSSSEFDSEDRIADYYNHAEPYRS